MSFDAFFTQIKQNIEANLMAADIAKTVIQRQQLFSMLNDRIRAGTSVELKADQFGTMGIEIHDPIGEQIRAQMLQLVPNFANTIFKNIELEVQKVMGERKFGGEDQVQHALLTGFLSNLSTSLATMYKAFYV